eukprot:GHVS01080517.1.p1 GENE.GHVS01080517.1~~GHVS01080517.1.p1  ORF type:complete len:463 (+),score=101.92 GHVS01080517.1:79-1467(+)
MSAGDVHSILYRGEDPLAKASFAPKFDPNKRVQRYWPGKAPDFAGVDSEEEFEAEVGEEDAREVEEITVDTSLQDRRLERIHQAAAEESINERIRRRREELEKIAKENEVLSDSEDDEECTEGRRRSAAKGNDLSKVEEDVVVLGKKTVKKEEDDDAIAARRVKMRERAKAHRMEEESKLEEEAANHQAGNEEVYESSEYDDSESDNDDTMGHALHKPVFVPKTKRNTVQEKELEEMEEIARAEDKKKKLAERKHQSHQLLVDALHREEQEASVMTSIADDVSDNEMPDDADDLNEAEEYELWKIRELKRIKRDKEEREARTRFLEEIERRRGMTDEERRIDDRRLDAGMPMREKKFKYAFMQKYYHRGAFFQDKAVSGQEPLYLRDYAAPVGEDKLDKHTLPHAMKLRRGQFGKQGQSKHTHLMDVDTTDVTAPWSTEVPLNKHAGIKAKHSFERPAGSKK